MMVGTFMLSYKGYARAHHHGSHDYYISLDLQETEVVFKLLLIQRYGAQMVEELEARQG